MLVQFIYFVALLMVACLSAAAFRFMQAHSRPSLGFNYGTTAVTSLEVFHPKLKKEIARAERFGYPLTVVSLNMRLLNDDEVDTSYSAALKQSLLKASKIMPKVRQYDLLGLDSENDKMVAAFPGADRAQAQEVIERIAATLEQQLSIQVASSQRFCIGHGLIMDELTVRAAREPLVASSAV